MTTTINAAGNVVGDTVTQETAARIAAAVRAFAAALPAGHRTTVDLQPPTSGDVLWVDTVAVALGLEPGTEQMSSGSWHRSALGWLGSVRVGVFTAQDEPREAKRARLTAELAELDAQVAANGTEGDRG